MRIGVRRSKGCCLLSLLVLASCLEAQVDTVTVGIVLPENMQFVVNEEDGMAEVCAEVKQSVPQFSKNFGVIFQDRHAIAGVDYMEVEVSFSLSNDKLSHCFNIPVIDDDLYERREGFFVNLTTTDNGVVFSPNHVVVDILDNEMLSISWVRAEYTVREEEGTVEVCAEITGKQTVIIAIHQVRFLERTAIDGTDYTSYIGRLEFHPETSTTQCFNISIISDIAFEGNKEFVAHIRPNEQPTERVVVDRHNTTITIIDYNVITVQQPASISDGLTNLINTSIPDNITCRVLHNVDLDGVECSSPEEILTLAIPSPCNSSLIVVITDVNRTVLLNKTILSKSHPQQIKYRIQRDEREFNISVQAVTHQNDSVNYYILSLEGSSIELELPMTAIPVNCPPSTLGLCPNDRSSCDSLNRTSIYIIAALVGSTLVLILVAILVATCVCAAMKGHFKVHPKK